MMFDTKDQKTTLLHTWWEGILDRSENIEVIRLPRERSCILKARDKVYYCCLCDIGDCRMVVQYCTMLASVLS